MNDDNDAAFIGDRWNEIVNLVGEEFLALNKRINAMQMVLKALLNGDLTVSPGDPLPWRVEGDQYATLKEACLYSRHKTDLPSIVDYLPEENT